MAKEEEKKDKPIQKFRMGGISASVWKNVTKKDGEDIEYNSVTLQKSYKDKDGNWKTTGNLNLNDLPKAIVVLNKAYEYIGLKIEDN